MQPPELIYHYTNASGLLGILDKGCLWCTHIRYLNDSQEFLHGLTIYRQVLTELADAQSGDRLSVQFARTALFRLGGENMENRLLADAVRYFVASFSARNDDLSQWRAYGGTVGLASQLDSNGQNSRSLRRYTE